MTKRRLIVIGFIVVLTVIAAGMLLLYQQSQPIFHNIMGYSCVYPIVNDINGNGEYDKGEEGITIPGLEIEVDDPSGSDSGRFAAKDCLLRPTGKSRQVRLHFLSQTATFLPRL